MERRALVMLAAAVLATALAGCVDRKLTITSEPSGALVYVSDVEVGRTPVTVPFTWYGDYEIILRPAGAGEEGPSTQPAPYGTLRTHTWILPPAYDVPPWDLISQAFVPWTYHYHVHRHFVLPPLELPPDEQLIENAQQLQQRNLEDVR